MSVWYRVQQFWHALVAQPFHAENRRVVNEYLGSQEQALFNQYSRSDQWHSYHVFCILQEAGHTQPDLLMAALLHDVGKSRMPLAIWERVLIVLAQVAMPHKTMMWGRGNMKRWKRPFIVKAQHPTWGAEMAQFAGCTPLAVALIRRHQERLPVTASAATQEEKLLHLLQWADNQN